MRLSAECYPIDSVSKRQLDFVNGTLLHERSIDTNHETIRFWWNRFGPIFAAEIRKRRMLACILLEA